MSIAAARLNSPLSLRQLRCFLLVEQEGSIGRAAEEMGITQPAASNAIAKLEQQFGATLLARGTSGCAPSPTGEILMVRIRRFFNYLQQGIAALQVATDFTTHSKLRMTQLRVHVAIAECGNFKRAAKSLGITEPALHRSARELEKLLRRTLYKPAANGIGVNAAGEVLARHMRLALNEIKQAREEIVHAHSSAATRIAIGILPLLPKRWMARACARARTLPKEPQIEIREANYEFLLRDLQWGAVDFIVGALRSLPDELGVTQEPLFADPYVLVARRGHPLAKSSSVRPQMLAKYDWVIPSQPLPRRAAIEQIFDRLPARPKIWLETNSPSMMLAALSETDCITLISRVQLLNDGLDLAALNIASQGTRAVGITSRRDWLPTPVQRQFLEILRELPRSELATGTVRNKKRA